VNQSLLQGFSPSVNNRNIRVARNNLKVSNLQVKLQVITTVSAVLNLYWDLVSFNEDLKARRDELATAQQLYEDNKKRVAAGAIAPIDIIQAEAGSGDIRGNGTPKNLWSIRTGSGNVDLRVPSEAGFDVDVSSNSGTVVVDHPVTTTVQGRVQERKSVVGKVKNGGPTISVHTGSGDIRLD